MEKNLEQQVESILEQEYIILAAFEPRRTIPMPIRPVEDRNGKLITGQGKGGRLELLTKDEKDAIVNGGSVIIDRNSKFVAEDGKKLDLKDPIDKAYAKYMLLDHPYICLSKEDRSRKKDAVFYILNVEKEAEERVTNSAFIDKARYLIREQSAEKQIKIAKAMGLTAAESISGSQLLDWLLQEANSVEGAKAILSAMSPEMAARNNAKAFFHELVTYKVIDKEAGIWNYGGEKGTNLGHTDDVAVDFLLDTKNVEFVRSLKIILASKKPELSNKMAPVQSDLPS